MTALELERLARLVAKSRGQSVNHIGDGAGVQKYYGDKIVIIWNVVRSIDGAVVDEIDVEMAWAHPKRTRETHQRILLVRNGRVSFYMEDPTVSEHLTKLTLLDTLAEEG